MAKISADRIKQDLGVLLGESLCLTITPVRRFF